MLRPIRSVLREHSFRKSRSNTKSSVPDSDFGHTIWSRLICSGREYQGRLLCFLLENWSTSKRNWLSSDNNCHLVQFPHSQLCHASGHWWSNFHPLDLARQLLRWSHSLVHLITASIRNVVSRSFHPFHPKIQSMAHSHETATVKPTIRIVGECYPVLSAQPISRLSCI